MARRTYKTEAIVLRSMRFSEADRILHLYTAHGGRIGAIAKGVRKTKSRFGARLEPLSHVELLLHEGGGEPCDRCGTPIDKIRVAGRGTWYCPSCQRVRRASSYAASKSSRRPSRSRRQSSV